jgi:tetratricopeptide (TPR) repeat protein
VHQATSIDPDAFIHTVGPLLEKQDMPGLLCLLKTQWTYDQIRGLLNSRHNDAKKVALLALGLVAPSCCIPDLAQQLRDDDPMINEMAEHALWMVWFRAGTAGANHELARGAQAIERREFEHAITHFDRAIEASPNFAEAYNQRAIALYLMEQYEKSIEYCRRAVELMPCHFGALAGMGHCFAHLDRAREAIESYERALEVNPHLECIRQTIEELRKKL